MSVEPDVQALLAERYTGGVHDPTQGFRLVRNAE